MARACACCAHPQRAAIEAQLIGGRSLRAVAADFGISPAALYRHSTNHLAARLAASAVAHRADVEGVDRAAAVEELQPVATDPASVWREPRRPLQLDDTAPSEPATPQATASHSIPAAPATGMGTEAIGPLDPYALACELRDSAVRILRNAAASGDAKLALEANRTAVGVLDRLARLMPRNSGDTASLPLQLAPEWHRLRAALMSALDAFPEARTAVAAALSEVDRP